MFLIRFYANPWTGAVCNDQSSAQQWQQQGEHDRRTCSHCSLIKLRVCIAHYEID